MAAITRIEPLLLFDAATRDDSTVALRVSVVAPARTESAFQSLTAKAKAKRFQHLHVTKWHRMSWREAQQLFGFAAQDIPGMEECFRLRFAELVPDLPKGAVELVRSPVASLSSSLSRPHRRDLGQMLPPLPFLSRRLSWPGECLP